MSNDLINWYDKLNIKGSGAKLPSTFKNHHILHNSMILEIGQTGTGKTNALMNFLQRSSGEFHKIFICSFSTTDEPLYNAIKKLNSSVEFYDNIEEVPDLSEFDNKTKDKPKLIVFDDFINLSPKEFKKINPYLIAGRKHGFTVWLMAQNYTSIPKIITRNIQYFIIFRLNDNVSINRIIHNHNISFIPKDVFKELYLEWTTKPMDFMMIDLKTSDPKWKLRHNFLGIM